MLVSGALIGASSWTTLFFQDTPPKEQGGDEKQEGGDCSHSKEVLGERVTVTNEGEAGEENGMKFQHTGSTQARELTGTVKKHSLSALHLLHLTPGPYCLGTAQDPHCI